MLVDTSYPIQAWNIPIGRQEKLQLWIGRVLGVHQFEIAEAVSQSIRSAHRYCIPISYAASGLRRHEERSPDGLT